MFTSGIYVFVLSVCCSYGYLYTSNSNKFEDFAERVNYIKIILKLKKNSNFAQDEELDETKDSYEKLVSYSEKIEMNKKDESED